VSFSFAAFDCDTGGDFAGEVTGVWRQTARAFHARITSPARSVVAAVQCPCVGPTNRHQTPSEYAGGGKTGLMGAAHPATPQGGKTWSPGCLLLLALLPRHRSCPGWTAAIRTSGCFLATTADDLIQMSGRWVSARATASVATCRRSHTYISTALRTGNVISRNLFCPEACL
jgi:hypothetical protein